MKARYNYPQIFKQGDLVLPKFSQGIFLFPNLYKQTWSNLITTESPWKNGLGLVIDTVDPNNVPNDLTQITWVKILTPEGVGWCMENKLEKL